MAVAKNTDTEFPGPGQGQGFLVQWGPLANGDTGDLFDMTGFEPLSFQVEGTFGTGGSVSLEGSNDGTNKRAVKDPNGTAVTLTAAGIAAVGTNTRYVRPNCTAGDGTTALTASLWLRKARHR